jgi:hypothetical protein
MVSGISSYILTSTCFGLGDNVLRTQLRVKLSSPASMTCNVITSGYSFLIILMTGRCSHNNILTWLPECANPRVMGSISWDLWDQLWFWTHLCHQVYFHSSICLIKVWRSVCLQISFTYFSFSLLPFCGWKRYITVVFFFQKMTLWNSLPLSLRMNMKVLVFVSYTFKVTHTWSLM